MSNILFSSNRTWKQRFSGAFSGLLIAIKEEASCKVHAAVTLLVLAAALILHINKLEFCIIVLCVGCVWAAELINSAIEWLAHAVDENVNPKIAVALDISSAAVLVMAFGSIIIGIVVFLPYLLHNFFHSFMF